MWEELAKEKGVLWCDQHSLPLNITAVDGIAVICSNGAERDPYEFNAKIDRHMKSLHN